MTNECVSACKQKMHMGIQHGLCAICVDELRERIRTVESELYRLKKAVSPSSVGDERWDDDGPSIDYFVGVAERMRARESKIRAVELRDTIGDVLA